ncbi:galactose-specific lectin nattectin-like [Xyrichtys novacula]|uniref:Galactose-specific lectin nattectin-like n=1 Tax=Xyrichtys novacula TaxID=13765 RepID=A0AAV1FER5_XYRNO|nr:galactose-specific lectin nattectin-like [Xyrichtys novacula]
MAFNLQLVVLLCVSSGLWMGANARCPKKDECCMACPDGWTRFEGRCFKFHFGPKGWCDAESQCINEGGNLASIRTVKELEILRNFTKLTTGQEARTWMGGFDAVKEDCWQWADGYKFDFDSWAPGEPNNYGPGEHCMEMSHTGMNLN